MHKKKHISCTIMILLIVAFDQLTKYLASSRLTGGKTVQFLPGIVQFRYAENTGMAFSMLSGARWIFITFTVIICAGVLWYLFSNKCSSLWVYWSLGVIVSGGMGNLIDRAFNGFVVDFIEPVFVSFAVFNIADCAVTCGAVVMAGYLLVDSLKKGKSADHE